MKNDVIFDGFVYGDPKVFEKVVTLTVNAQTHSVKKEDGSYKNYYTSIRIRYFGPQSQKMKDYLKKGSPVRITGKIDTETYEDKNGKKIYNIYLVAKSITKISFEKETKDGKQVTVVKEEVLV